MYNNNCTLLAPLNYFCGHSFHINKFILVDLIYLLTMVCEWLLTIVLIYGENWNLSMSLSIVLNNVSNSWSLLALYLCLKQYIITKQHFKLLITFSFVLVFELINNYKSQLKRFTFSFYKTQFKRFNFSFHKSQLKSFTFSFVLVFEAIHNYKSQLRSFTFSFYKSQLKSLKKKQERLKQRWRTLKLGSSLCIEVQPGMLS